MARKSILENIVPKKIKLIKKDYHEFLWKEN